MTLKKYKNIDPFGKNENTRGQRVKEKDRALFERNSAAITFGASKRDVIEFALYDTNDNLLGWTTKLQDSVILLDSGEVQRKGNPPELLITPPDDIIQAGFKKGAFKLSYQFLHNRVGDNITNNKVYVQEISPSRTEVRILPVLTGDESRDTKLVKDFQHFKHNDLSKSDVILMVKSIFTSITLEDIDSLFNDNFILQFSSDYAVNGKNMEIIKLKILDEVETTLISIIKNDEHEHMSLNRIRGLFSVVLSSVIDRYIPKINKKRILPADNIKHISEMMEESGTGIDVGDETIIPDVPNGIPASELFVTTDRFTQPGKRIDLINIVLTGSVDSINIDKLRKSLGGSTYTIGEDPNIERRVRIDINDERLSESLDGITPNTRIELV